MLKNRKAEYQKALEELGHVRGALREARGRFDEMTDQEQLDVCIYEISALTSKYNCALRSIKTLYF